MWTPGRKRLYLDGHLEDLVDPPDGLYLGQRWRIKRGSVIQTFMIVGLWDDSIEMMSLDVEAIRKLKEFGSRWREVRAAHHPTENAVPGTAESIRQSAS